MGIAGVAPDVTLVNLRSGQDSGYFFLQATLVALTYAGNTGIDVVNMGLPHRSLALHLPEQPG